MIGIYKITNKINGKIYIGQSVNITKRWNTHKRRAFIPSKEYDKYLYRAFRKYGLENFSFEVEEECLKEELSEKENYYILLYHSNDDKYGYNETTGYEYAQYGMRGEAHPKHKLTEDEVYYIRECYNQHYDKNDVYDEFADRISEGGFHKIWLGQNWREVHMDVYTEENRQYYLFERNSHKGAANGRALLTEDMVRDIRLRRKNGESRQDVYKDYAWTGIAEGSFRRVWLNENWKHIVV